MSFWEWFKNSQRPRTVARTREQRQIERVAAEAERQSQRVLREPHYYVFYYPKGREPGSGWKHPKAYEGPFATLAAAEEGLKDSWPAKAGEPRSRFKIQQLTDRQFEKIWGALPGQPVEGY